LERVEDPIYMQRCLELAVRAQGFTWPNPVVGSVIVHNGIIIGEGYHLKAGMDHAEVAALNSVKERALLKESTLYVNLEPCSHFGRTPPCAERIIAEGIPRVVVGTTDTSSKVSGKGIEMMRMAGIEVVTGVCEEEARKVNRRFFTFHEAGRPYVILKWAMSADGYIDVMRPMGAPVAPYWITGMTERILVHRWRSEEQSIVAGGGTIRSDNPELNVRYWKGNDPVKVIISRSADLNESAAVFSGTGPKILFTARQGPDLPGTERVILNCSEDVVAGRVLEHLHARGIGSVFVEGGRRVHEMFINEGLWDEARIFTGLLSWGNGVAAPVISGRLESTTKFTDSTLEVLINTVIH
jgi:diaminohydroxyphosphoribosylaminopyrimidine deaminase / 5-amino-6-(5-phosphoribosylamino)uracil reductase